VRGRSSGVEHLPFKQRVDGSIPSGLTTQELQCKLELFFIMEKRYHLYILQSEKDGTYYVGSTSNLEDRISRHNGGRSKFTKNRIPWKLVYTEEFSSKIAANHRELEIKKWKSRKMIEKLIVG
jgi:putative endonuclease